jgi:hypothetical protein
MSTFLSAFQRKSKKVVEHLPNQSSERYSCDVNAANAAVQHVKDLPDGYSWRYKESIVRGHLSKSFDRYQETKDRSALATANIYLKWYIEAYMVADLS